jgi:hypothetical protein
VQVKKRLIFHIGSHKTATTFLQGSFANSSAALASMGVLYPTAGQVYDGHFKLCWDLKDHDLRNTPLDRLPNWAALWSEVEASPLQTVLLSSETFGWGIDPDRLAGLADRFAVTVVYYLRSPDSLLESFYNQLVKDFVTRETRTLETYMAEEPLAILDPARTLRPWAEMFGAKAIKLRLFGKEHLPDGILDDFLRAIGFKSWPAFGEPRQSTLHKVSLPPDALEYLRLSNPWLDQAKGHYDFVLRLARLSEMMGAQLHETRSGILSHRARHVLRQRVRAPHVEAVRAYSSLSRAPFPAADAPEPEFYADRLPEATAQIMGKVAALIRLAG